MKIDNQIKLNISIGLLLVIVPLLGIPYSYKTFIIVALGAVLVYFAVALRQKDKIKKNKKSNFRKASVFEESKPSKHEKHPELRPEVINSTDSEIIEVISQDNYENLV